jgi:hypothetical protein
MSDAGKQGASGAGAGDGNAGAGGDAHVPYELEPLQNSAEPYKPPSLLQGFEEGTDFTKDPEVERALKTQGAGGGGSGSGGGREKVDRAARREKGERAAREPATQPSVGEAAEVAEGDFAKPGLGNAQVTAGIGLGLTAAAMIVAGVTSNEKVVANVLVTGYQALLHAGTGLFAVALTAHLVERRVGLFELAAARMLVATAALLLVFLIPMPLTNTKGEEVVAAGLVYLLVVFLYFRRTVRETGIIAGLHFALWLIVWLGARLEVWSTAAGAAGAATGGGGGAVP